MGYFFGAFDVLDCGLLRPNLIQLSLQIHPHLLILTKFRFDCQDSSAVFFEGLIGGKGEFNRLLHLSIVHAILLSGVFIKVNWVAQIVSERRGAYVR